MKKTLLEKTADRLVNAFIDNKIISPIQSKFTKKLSEAEKLRKLCGEVGIDPRSDRRRIRKIEKVPKLIEEVEKSFQTGLKSTQKVFVSKKLPKTKPRGTSNQNNIYILFRKVKF